MITDEKMARIDNGLSVKQAVERLRITEGDSVACWPSALSQDKDGYPRGNFGGRHGKRFYAHRFMYAVANGLDPTLMDPKVVIMHSCDNTNCCNPHHLRAGTQIENIADRDRKGRQASAERNGRSKLTTAIVIECRRLYYGFGVSSLLLAKRYNVARKTMSDAIDGTHWKQVPL